MVRQYYLMVPGKGGQRLATNHDADVSLDAPERRLSFDTAQAAAFAAKHIVSRSHMPSVKIIAEIAIVTATGPRPVAIHPLEEKQPAPDDGGSHVPVPPASEAPESHGDLVG